MRSPSKPVTRKIARRKTTHCARGHEFTIENTRYHSNKRICRKCALLRDQTQRMKGRTPASLEVKRCSKCSVVQPIAEFGREPRSADGWTYWCHACNRLKAHERAKQRVAHWSVHDPYEEHPTGIKRCGRCAAKKPVRDFSRNQHGPDGLQGECRPCQVARWQLRQFGVSAEGQVCALCGSTKRLSVDHDHTSGKVRGILCSNCNTGLGLFKEQPMLLRKAAVYLEMKLL